MSLDLDCVVFDSELVCPFPDPLSVESFGF